MLAPAKDGLIMSAGVNGAILSLAGRVWLSNISMAP